MHDSNASDTTAAQRPQATTFIVCGLGSLGQNCAKILKDFGVEVYAIELNPNAFWEIPHLPDLLDALLVGDCRQPSLLEKAQIYRCRTVLLVTSDERVNLEAAFVARSLNPRARLVMRSSQENLNHLLENSLGNFVAFEPTHLTAPAFALAALGEETQGCFNLQGQFLRIMSVDIHVIHPWANRRHLHELNTSSRHILGHARGKHVNRLFHAWNPEDLVRTGDSIIYLEVIPHLPQAIWQESPGWQTPKMRRMTQKIHQLGDRIWTIIRRSQSGQAAIVGSGILFGLFCLGALLYKIQTPDISWAGAINAALILTLGDFGELFNSTVAVSQVPWWLYLFSLGLTLTGTLLIGILYAFLTERLLEARFQFMKRRPVVPKQGHVVIVGLGRVGQQVAAFLQEMKYRVVGIHAHTIAPDVLPQMPVIVGTPQIVLSQANVSNARSVIAVTDDEVMNLEISLMARAINPVSKLVLRTVNPIFNTSVAQLLPYAKVLGAYELAAEAFVAAAFGENVLSLFRIHDQTVLVTDYQIDTTDTLHDLLMSEIAYGYGVVPILHESPDRNYNTLMPLDDTRLQSGDRLVVLATIEGLRMIEQGMRTKPNWGIRVERAISPTVIFEGGSTIARITGCPLALARQVMQDLPALLPFPLYRPQAQRLVRELGKIQVIAKLIEYRYP